MSKGVTAGHTQNYSDDNRSIVRRVSDEEVADAMAMVEKKLETTPLGISCKECGTENLIGRENLYWKDSEHHREDVAAFVCDECQTHNRPMHVVILAKLGVLDL